MKSSHYTLALQFCNTFCLHQPESEYFVMVAHQRRQIQTAHLNISVDRQFLHTLTFLLMCNSLKVSMWDKVSCGNAFCRLSHSLSTVSEGHKKSAVTCTGSKYMCPEGICLEYHWERQSRILHSTCSRVTSHRNYCYKFHAAKHASSTFIAEC